MMETQSLNQNMQTSDSKMAQEISELADTNQFQNTLTKDKLKMMAPKEENKELEVIREERKPRNRKTSKLS